MSHKQLRTATMNPKESNTGICTECAGLGRVPDVHATGKRKRTKVCMLCRGTGKSDGKYQIK